MRTRLRGFGPVRALVWGAYGEASDDVHQLLEVVVEAEADRSWRVLGARSSAEARSYLTMRTVRSWGITAVREMARHRLRRLEYVGARQLPRGPLRWRWLPPSESVKRCYYSNT